MKDDAVKRMTVWGILAFLVTGGSGYVASDPDLLFAIPDQRYVKIADQNLKYQWDIEDELAQIQKKIDNGTATTDDLVRKGVLEDRLRRLKGE